MMAVFFFIAHEKGFKFHAQPQTGASSCFICNCSNLIDFVFIFITIFICHVQPLVAHGLKIYLFIHFISWCWSHTLLIILRGLTALKTSVPAMQVYSKTYLNTLSTQTPRGQELLGHIRK